MTACPDIENAESLRDYLVAQGRIGQKEQFKSSILRGGVSNKTVLVERTTGESWVVKQPLAKLRVDAEWLSDIHRIHREALGLKWLGRLAPAGSIPDLVFEDDALHLLAMQAVPQPHENWKTLLLNAPPVPDHVDQFALLLAGIHGNSALQADQFAVLFEDRSFFQSLRLDPYFAFAAKSLPDAQAFLHQLIDDTLSRRLTIVHGDYSPKNVLVHQERLVLLDHEVIHFGDPAFDLGFGMCHLLSKGNHLVDRRPEFQAAAQQFWTTYSQAVGEAPWTQDLEAMAVRQTLGCLLARVAGKSPLEYLNADARSRQRDAALSLCRRPPERVDLLIDAFLEKCE